MIMEIKDYSNLYLYLLAKDEKERNKLLSELSINEIIDLFDELCLYIKKM